MKDRGRALALFVATVAFGLLASGEASAKRARIVTVIAPRAALLLEVADTPRARARGLMFRRRLEPRTGMLFVFEAEAERVFWMEHTLVPLDMIFIGDGGRVASVAANVPAMRPGDPDARIARRRGTARYVIELPAGEAARDGLAPGMSLSLDAVR